MELIEVSGLEHDLLSHLFLTLDLGDRGFLQFFT